MTGLQANAGQFGLMGVMDQSGPMGQLSLKNNGSGRIGLGRSYMTDGYKIGLGHKSGPFAAEVRREEGETEDESKGTPEEESDIPHPLRRPYTHASEKEMASETESTGSKGCFLAGDDKRRIGESSSAMPEVIRCSLEGECLGGSAVQSNHVCGTEAEPRECNQGEEGDGKEDARLSTPVAKTTGSNIGGMATPHLMDSKGWM